MRTTIVSGLLGAGKTTFIKNILADSTEKAVVLVNDFGQTGIDGELLTSEGIEAVELPSGCVCCTLRFDLIGSVEKIKETFGPEHLVIEPSGVASPTGVLEALETLDVGPVTVVGIADATEFAELHEQEVYGPFFADQIRSSDVVLINKTDLADEETVSETRRLVEELNPHAVVISTVMAKVEGPLPEAGGRQEPADGASHALRYETVCLKPEGTVKHDKIEALFENLASGEFGNVARAKALLVTERGPYLFDLASGQYNARKFDRDPQGNRVVIIGTGLDRNGLTKAL
jgi:G3E family GTPase